MVKSKARQRHGDISLFGIIDSLSEQMTYTLGPMMDVKFRVYQAGASLSVASLSVACVMIVASFRSINT